MKQDQKFETIITSYINGNISWVRDQVKKLSKNDRKLLYNSLSEYCNDDYDTRQFFLNLI